MPFRRPVNLPKNEQCRWRELKCQMAEIAEKGFDMREYLSLLRKGDAVLPQSVTRSTPSRMAPK